MLVVGLTGGIGAGKTTVENEFKALGVPVIDVDDIAREIVQAGTPCHQQIISHFGQELLKNNGELDRHALRNIIFRDPAKKQWLEDLLHPLIRQTILDRIAQYDWPYCIVSIPLLTESSGYYYLNRILVVDCPENLQIERSMKRDDCNEEEIRAIIDAQAKRAERLAKADDVILNEYGLDDLKADVLRLHRSYSGE